jgi:hypothetical protein
VTAAATPALEPGSADLAAFPRFIVALRLLVIALVLERELKTATGDPLCLPCAAGVGASVNEERRNRHAPRAYRGTAAAARHFGAQATRFIALRKI